MTNINEVRDEKHYFDDIPDVKISKDMLELAEHILDTKTEKFINDAEADKLLTREYRAPYVVT